LRKAIEAANSFIHSNDLSDLEELFQDYQQNSLAWPMMSLKLRDIIARNLSGSEGINWITCIVNASEAQKQYYIPRFSQEI